MTDETVETTRITGGGSGRAVAPWIVGLVVVVAFGVAGRAAGDGDPGGDRDGASAGSADSTPGRSPAASGRAPAAALVPTEPPRRRTRLAARLTDRGAIVQGFVGRRLTTVHAEVVDAGGTVIATATGRSRAFDGGETSRRLRLRITFPEPRPAGPVWITITPGDQAGSTDARPRIRIGPLGESSAEAGTTPGVPGDAPAP